ncbi:hypothetical protein N2605_31015 [Bradyrhizobium yuanmingense]|nr:MULTISPECIES: hypothetical protein [unclassified Bradyrhizobium]UWU83897.1 hypothetical protein N2605_31015 [Bradyrhizobium sp. CB1024]
MQADVVVGNAERAAAGNVPAQPRWFILAAAGHGKQAIGAAIA